MRKLLLTGVIAALGLTAVGVAVARLSAEGTATVSGSFSATNSQGVRSRTCTGPDGDYQILDGIYTGNATSSESSLSGDVRVRIRSIYNTTEKTGWATGWLKFHGSGALRFDAVNANGKLTGFVRGRVGRSYAALLGSFSADFSSGGLANGQLGGGGTVPNVALLAGRICTQPAPNKSVKLTVKGMIDSVSSTSLAVAPQDGSPTQTCTVGSGSPSTSGLAKGQKVEMTCATVNGRLTVVRIRKRG